MDSSKHQIGFSMTDGSFWCFACDDYITSKECEIVGMVFGESKFGVEDLAHELGAMKIAAAKDDPIKEFA